MEQPILYQPCDLQVSLASADVLNKNNPPMVHVVDGPRVSMTLNGDTYQARIPLSGETIQYWIDVNGERRLHRANPLVGYFDGTEVSETNRPSCESPALYLTENPEADPDEIITLVLARSSNGGPLRTSSVQAMVGDVSLPVHVTGDHVDIHVHELPIGKHHLRVEVEDTSGHRVIRDGPIWVEDEPFRWSDAILYQIMIDRFAGERDLGPRARAQSPGLRAGGTLKGVLRKLQDGYFEALGVNVLWLSPVYENATGLWPGVEGGVPRYSSYHGYWPIQPRALEPRLGDAADLHALVAAAHARGMRVILDVVPNHIHEDHPYREQFPEWFGEEPCICGSAECPWWRDIQTCWFTPYMPDVDWTQPGSVDHIVEDLLWWVETFDLDGLRVDAVPMMPRRFTRHLVHQARERFEGMGTRMYLLGETFTGPEGYEPIRYALGPHGLDGQFDFPLMWALRSAFAWESDGLDTLYQKWQTSQRSWAGSDAIMATMIGNHDVTRFASEAQGRLGYADPWTQPAESIEDVAVYDQIKLAWTFIMTMPGLPIIYSGDEYGEVGGRDPDNRRPTRFGADRSAAERELHDTVSSLGRLRRCLPALRSPTVELLEATTDRLVLRRGAPHDVPAIIIFQRNRTSPPMRLSLPMMEGPLQEALSGQIFDPDKDTVFPSTGDGMTAHVWLPVGNPCVENQ